MKTRFGMLALAAVAVVGLSGCTTPLTKNQYAERFEAGENTIYIHVKGVNKDLSKIQCPGSSVANVLSETGKDKFAKSICNNLNNLQVVSGFYWTHPRKGIQFFGGYAPIGLDVERGDFVKLSQAVAANGELDGPATVVAVARKAKDASKESGCYWEGGAMFTNAFVSGGVVCDGWDWKKQKFAQ